MAITKDTHVYVSNKTTSSSHSHTVSGTNTAMIVFVSCYQTTQLTPTVTCGGTSMTMANSYNGLNFQTYVFYLLNPGTGAKTIAMSGMGVKQNSIYSISFNGVLQTGGYDTVAGSSGSTNTDGSDVTITTALSNEVIVACQTSQPINGTISPTTYTLIQNDGNGTLGYFTSTTGYGIATSSGSNTFAWSGQSSGYYHYGVAIALKPTVTAAAETASFLYLMV